MAMPTEFATPWPSGPVVVSTPDGACVSSGCPGVFEWMSWGSVFEDMGADFISFPPRLAGLLGGGLLLGLLLLHAGLLDLVAGLLHLLGGVASRLGGLHLGLALLDLLLAGLFLALVV